MRTAEIARSEGVERKALIEQYVEETIETVVRGGYSVNELRTFHGGVNELNRRMAHEESAEDLDKDALRFMHEVTKIVLKHIGTRSKLQNERWQKLYKGRYLKEFVVE